MKGLLGVARRGGLREVGRYHMATSVLDFSELIRARFMPRVQSVMLRGKASKKRLKRIAILGDLLAGELAYRGEEDLVLLIRRLVHHLEPVRYGPYAYERPPDLYELWPIWHELKPRLEALSDLLQFRSVSAAKGSKDYASEHQEPDGPEGGRFVLWQGKRHEIERGNVYRLLAFMWKRLTATYDDLNDLVFDTPHSDNSIRADIRKVNRKLETIGIPWRLSANAKERCIVKEQRT